MAKTKPVKWALGGDEPEDLQDFLSNDDIERKHGLPPKGKYTLSVRRIQIREIQNGDNAGENRLSVMLFIEEPKKSDYAKWNGWLIWDGFNVTDQGAPFLKRFLKALGLSWKDFINKSKQNDEDPPELLQIAGVKFGASAQKNPTVTATTKQRKNRQTDEPEIVVGTYVPKDAEGEDDSGDEPSDDAAVESFDTGDEGEGDAWTREDFDDEDEYDDAAVKKIAIEDFEIVKKDLKGKDREEMLDLMFAGTEMPDNREQMEEELREALKGLNLTALRKRAVRADIDTEDMKKKDLVEAIMEAELPPF